MATEEKNIPLYPAMSLREYMTKKTSAILTLPKSSVSPVTTLSPEA